MLNDFGVTTSASKRSHRKGKYLKNVAHWVGVHKETRKQAARSSRRDNRLLITEGRGGIRTTPDQGKRRVATNRCGNECGRRASITDYLCPRCRS